jgi:hypothetical protein
MIPPTIISLENYTFLTRQVPHEKTNVFGVLHQFLLRGFSNAHKNLRFLTNFRRVVPEV